MTIGQVRGWALGLLHMSRDEFYLMRPGEFWEAMDAHSREKEADRMHAGELARGAALRIFNIMASPKCRITEPDKFWRMPWDEEPIVDTSLDDLQVLTDEERAQQARDFIAKIGW